MKFKQAFLAEPGRFIIEEVDMEPAANQVMVKVASCGLCNWELNHWKGYIVKPGGYPFPLGHEFAGEVVKAGEAVTKFKVGDKKLEMAKSYGDNSRGIGPADMAIAIAEGKQNRASSQLALHVLDIIECMVKSTQTGSFVQVESTCQRPEPM